MLDGASKGDGCKIELEQQRCTDIRIIVPADDELVTTFDNLDSRATDQLGIRWDVGQVPA